MQLDQIAVTERRRADRRKANHHFSEPHDRFQRIASAAGHWDAVRPWRRDRAIIDEPGTDDQTGGGQ